MSKTLVFAEKPSVGRDIARILGATRQGKGYLEGTQYVVSWGVGHLVCLGEPDVQNPEWKKWSLAMLPMLPAAWKLVAIPQTKDQFDVVCELLKRDDIADVVNAADAGREGELIFRLVYNHAGCTKPVRRLWISSMTDEAIRAGFAGLKPGAEYDNLAAAAECRSRADWLVGMNFTRAYTKKFNTDSVLSVGRVQTPTLAMVVRRHQEIANFKPVDFWEVVADLGDFSAIWFDPKEKTTPTRIPTIEAARAVMERLRGTHLDVTKVTTTKKKQPPPLLYDLTTLQREANSRYGFTAAQTLAAAQSLYEQRKALTYPRTDSRYLSDDLYKTVPQRFKALPPAYAGYLAPLRAEKLPKSKRVFDNAQVSDHHAIIPTEQKPGGMAGWKPEEQKVYDLVARRFLAVFYPDHEYLATAVTLQAGKEDHFKANGRVTVQIGWKAVYEKTQPEAREPDGAAEEGDDEQALPELKKGDEREVKEAKLQVRQTKPPPAYTEATLLQAMETAGKLIDDEELRQAMKECGLGTPATRAETIEKLIRVGYMLREKKKLTPTSKGIQLISLVAPQVASPEMTGSWEKRLSDIARGKADAAQFMTDITGFVREIVGSVKTGRFETVRREDLRPPRPTFGTCPACGKGSIIEGKRGFGCDRFREGCNYVVWKEFQGVALPQEAIDALIAGKTTKPLNGFKTEDGRTVDGKIRMREDKTGIELVEGKAKAKTKAKPKPEAEPSPRKEKAPK
ncbi:MAG TPA: DNA topoisomerase 3 [Candidatus Ozemobacteraceae bacterium]|nr:DNA topoisomerase 3 [Candidatus Ozemobacteraceae bacterium]